MATESHDGPTPAGGVRSEITYLDDAGRPTAKVAATKCVIIEYGADGEQLRRTYGLLGVSSSQEMG